MRYLYLLVLMILATASAMVFTDNPIAASPNDLGKSLSDGSRVSFQSLVVTASFPALGFIYLEKQDKCTGIRVNTTKAFSEGQLVGVNGTIQTDPSNSERYVAADANSPSLSGGTLAVHSNQTSNRALGGGKFGLQLGITGANGLNNFGLLVKTWGKVTQIDPGGTYFYVDDGSGVSDGTTTDGATNVGIRVSFGGKPCSKGQFVAVTGISSCFKTTNGKIARLVRVRSAGDIKVLPLADLGPGASLKGNRPFPMDNPWNTPIDKDPVDPNSSVLINSIGLTTGMHPDFGANWDGGPFGIPYIVVDGKTPKVPVSFDYADESDPGPYPIPPNAPIEGGPNSTGDRHVLVIDRDNWKLYELYSAYPSGNGWSAGSGAVFDLNTNDVRPAGWTSADAAGLPIFPGLVRYDEVVEQKEIRHAIRFTVVKTRKAYVYPARHFASSYTGSDRPPMGMRVRLKSSYDISKFSPNIQVILKCLKTYGMILADNGSNWYISGAPDSRWNDDELSALKQVQGKDFEVVKMGTLITQ